MIKLISKKTSSAICLAIAATGLSTATFSTATMAQTPVSNAECVQPVQPIIPDGNVAQKEELVGASKAVKALQGELETYRNCLTNKSTAIVGEDEVSIAQKQAFIDRYNDSVTLEEKVADEFNTAISAFKSK